MSIFLLPQGTCDFKDELCIADLYRGDYQAAAYNDVFLSC